MKNQWLERRKTISVKASPGRVVVTLYDQLLDSMWMMGEKLTTQDRWCIRSELLFNYADVLGGYHSDLVADEVKFYEVLLGGK